MEICQRGKDLLLIGVQDFSVTETLDCGQCFRWEQNAPHRFTGVVAGKVCTIYQEGDTIVLENTSLADFEALWRNYFDLDRDYGNIKTLLCQSPTLQEIIAFAPGIRVLRQESWEALCSFILSQNNNIIRIKGIVKRLCQQWGEPLEGGHFSFPSPERLAGCSVEDLAPLRCGFRARYLLDAAQKVSSGTVDFARMSKRTTEEARAELMEIVGVGVKVADCALLYGMGRIDCLPADVWIKRALEQYFPQSIPEYALAYAGILQQYLYHYARNHPETAK